MAAIITLVGDKVVFGYSEEAVIDELVAASK